MGKPKLSKPFYFVFILLSLLFSTNIVNGYYGNLDLPLQASQVDGTTKQYYACISHSLFREGRSLGTDNLITDSLASQGLFLNKNQMDAIYDGFERLANKAEQDQEVNEFPHNFITNSLITNSHFRFDEENNELDIIFHVRNSIYNAYRGLSKLTNHRDGDRVLNYEGMTSVAGRHLLNNLCSGLNARYLEIGTWFGSSLLAAVAGNEANLKSVTAIDWWDWNNRNSFETLVNADSLTHSYESFNTVFADSQEAYDSVHMGLKFLTHSEELVSLIRSDCFKVDVDELLAKNKNQKFNIYLYDAEHQEVDQYMAFTYYDKVLSDVFIAVVDDWNHHGVAKGTKRAFIELGYTIMFGQVLGGGIPFGATDHMWHQGIYVAVVSKR